MSYLTYKILHLGSLLFFFILYAQAVVKPKDQIKKEVILTGVALILILVSGFGLLARLGIMHGQAWPIWVKLKFGIWLLVGATGHIVLKRFSHLKSKYIWVLFAIFISAAWLANAKIA